MSNDARATAARHLQRIAERNPLYRPALFTLGYLRLLDGDTDEAERIFTDLTERFNEEAKLQLAHAQELWSQTGLTYGFALKFRPLRRSIRPWLEQWVHIVALLEGGEFYKAAIRWARFDERRNGLYRARDRDKTAEQAMFHLFLAGFPERGGIRDLAMIAAGRKAGDEQLARETLDCVLSPVGIAALDHNLAMLEIHLGSEKRRSWYRQIEFDIPEDDTAERIRKHLTALRNADIVQILRSFGARVDQICEHWQTKNWDVCEKLLRSFRDLTRAPSQFEATTLFKGGVHPEVGSGTHWLWRLRQWHARQHIPAFDLPELWRNTFRNGFYLESEYYLALCHYQTFTTKGAGEAMRRAEALHTRLLAGAPPVGIDKKRYAELRLLAQCLEINAAMRILLADPSDRAEKDIALHASVRRSDLEAKVLRQVSKAADDAARNPSTRATIFCTLGLVKRYERREEERYQRKNKPDGKAEAQLAELDLYRRALHLDRSTDACFYLTETLAEAGRLAEAGLYHDEALRLCPGHAGANELIEAEKRNESWNATQARPGRTSPAASPPAPAAGR
jgi:hypothetical protein